MAQYFHKQVLHRYFYQKFHAPLATPQHNQYKTPLYHKVASVEQHGWFREVHYQTPKAFILPTLNFNSICTFSLVTIFFNPSIMSKTSSPVVK